MASTDATFVPVKNQAYRVTFPILDADGDLVAGATGLDSEISKDQGTFTDCTNEATQIATSSGMYYLDLTGTEMNADTVAIIVKNVEGKTVPIVIYPQEAGTELKVDVTHIGGSAVVASGGRPEVNVSHFGGSAGTFASGRPEINVSHWKGTTAATVDSAGYPVVTIKSGSGSGEISLSSGQVAISSSSETSIATKVWDTATTVPTTSGSFGVALKPTEHGTAQAGAASTITLRAGASATNSFYNKQLLKITGGTGVGQSEYISSYVGATKVATMAAAWATQPDNTSIYVIMGGGTIPGASAPTAVENADAVWNSTVSTHLVSGSFGQYLGGEVTRANTAQTGTTSSITLDAGASATDNLYRFHRLEIIGGTGANQASYVTAYNGSTKVATLDPALAVAPSSDSIFILRKLGIDASTPAAVATAVWAATRAGNGTAGSFGEYVPADAIRFSGDSTAADNAESFFDGTGYAGTNNVIPSVTTVTGNVNGSVASVTGNVGGSVATVTALAANSVNASALATDAVTEIQTGLATSAAQTTAQTDLTTIKGKTNSLTFTVGGQVDANVQYINDTVLVGNGSTTPWGP